MERSLGYILLLYLIVWYTLNLHDRFPTHSLRESLEHMGQVLLVLGVPALLVVWIRARTISAMLLFLLITVSAATLFAEMWHA